MSLSVSLSNALTGMNATQKGLDVVSRNVANASTPGYHRQQLSVIDGVNVNSTNVRVSNVQRAMDRSLEMQIHAESANAGYANTRVAFLERLEALLGKPGDSNSVDVLYNDFTRALDDLATSPDDFSVRAETLNRAQLLVETLHYLSDNIQLLRQETEQQLSNSVSELNSALGSLAEINVQLQRYTADDTATNALLDDRDRLLEKISTIIDIKVHENQHGAISIHTQSGLNLLDGTAAVFQFDDGGQIGADFHYSADPSQNEVGTLSLNSAAGHSTDLVAQDVIRSGVLKSLIELRDGALAGAQSQLDDIAAALSLALSTNPVAGVAATAGAATGFDIDLAGLQAGNATSLTYVEGGVQKKVSIVRVDDVSQLPMDSIGPNGVRTIGVDFSAGPAAVAAALDSALGTAVTVSNVSGHVYRFVDDGAVGNSSISSLSAGITATSLQGGGVALPMFTDAQKAFTGSLDGQDQRVGFASRIEINAALLQNNKLLVQYSNSPETNIGDATRPNFLVEQLRDSQFAFGQDSAISSGTTQLVGSVRQLIEQAMNFQGNQVSAAQQKASSQNIIMSSLAQRSESTYGVDIDTEMTRLMDLQNAYAANARIITIVQEMMNRLMQI